MDLIFSQSGMTLAVPALVFVSHLRFLYLISFLPLLQRQKHRSLYREHTLSMASCSYMCAARKLIAKLLMHCPQQHSRATTKFVVRSLCAPGVVSAPVRLHHWHCRQRGFTHFDSMSLLYFDGLLFLLSPFAEPLFLQGSIRRWRS